MGGSLGKRVDGQTDSCMDRWMDSRTGGWVDGKTSEVRLKKINDKDLHESNSHQ